MKRATDVQLARDRALMAELSGRLARLERDINRMYRPALRRLVAADEPGSSYALQELEDGVSGPYDDALDWFKRSIDGLVFAGGDPELWTWWYWGIDMRLCDGRRRSWTDSQVLNQMGSSGDNDTAEEFARYLAGKAKAAARK